MNRTTLRDVAIPLASLAVLIAVGYLAYGRIVGKQANQNQNSVVSESGRITVDPRLGSAVLPNDIPVPADATVNESFDIATKDGDIQGTRSYESTRSIDDEMAAYNSYLERNKWTVLDRKAADNYASVLSERDDKQLLASFSARAGKTYVTVTAIASPAIY